MNLKKRKVVDQELKKPELSLATLTNQFIEYVSKIPNKEIDLNELATNLHVPKRRIYDITNVLEGTHENRHQSHPEAQQKQSQVDRPPGCHATRCKSDQ
jgi:hypothetical protein